MPGQISRLATVSHILYDREVLELRQENERLVREVERLNQENEAHKLKYFWVEHSVYELQRFMLLYRRRHPNVTRDHEIWNVWIEPMLHTCGLSVQSVGGMLPYRDLQECELDTHLVCTTPYLFVTYGTKLWKAKSVDDPELLKLKALFNALE